MKKKRLQASDLEPYEFIHFDETVSNNERTENMLKNNKYYSTSSLISHLSYLKRKTVCRFTLIELLIVIAIIGIR